MARQTNVVCADGEVVWSLPPDAEVKAARSSRGRRGQESPVPGESTKETVKTIAQGMPVDLAEPVVLPPAFLLQAGHGWGHHPAFPAPSSFPEGEVTCNTRAWTRRGIA